MSFPDFELAGNQYSLEHLDAFRIVVPAKNPLARPAKLLVTFSHHVFSEKWDHSKHTIEYAYQHEKERRAFCPVRYGCSIRLKEILQYHSNGKAYLSKDGNGAISYLFYDEAEGISYPVFFRLRKASKTAGAHGLLHVISAYQNDRLPARNRLQSIKFARLVHQTCPPL